MLSPLKRVHFSDFWPGYNKEVNVFTAAMREHGVEYIITDDNPEYVVYCDFGGAHLRHENAVKLFYTGENSAPDFNICDYAMTYHPIQFDDRHFQRTVISAPMDYLDSDEKISAALSKKAKFCNFIYGNRSGESADPIRERFFDLLAQYKRVDAPGRSRNNMENTIPRAAGWAAKIDFMHSYKFSISFENSSQPGYTTEKIVDAFLADTIPIYWGNPRIGEIFCDGSFVNCHDYGSLEDVVKAVIELDSDDHAYTEMLRRRRTNDAYLQGKKAEFSEFIGRIFVPPKEVAARRTMFGLQKRLYTEATNKAGIATV